MIAGLGFKYLPFTSQTPLFWIFQPWSREWKRYDRVLSFPFCGRKNYPMRLEKRKRDREWSGFLSWRNSVWPCSQKYINKELCHERTANDANPKEILPRQRERASEREQYGPRSECRVDDVFMHHACHPCLLNVIW